jgi:hypothetical protein
MKEHDSGSTGSSQKRKGHRNCDETMQYLLSAEEPLVSRFGCHHSPESEALVMTGGAPLSLAKSLLPPGVHIELPWSLYDESGQAFKEMFFSASVFERRCANPLAGQSLLLRPSPYSSWNTESEASQLLAIVPGD